MHSTSILLLALLAAVSAVPLPVELEQKSQQNNNNDVATLQDFENVVQNDLRTLGGRDPLHCYKYIEI